jgi:hypothetical protein
MKGAKHDQVVMITLHDGRPRMSRLAVARVLFTIALTIVWAAPTLAQQPSRDARLAELVLVRLHDGHQLLGEVASLASDGRFFVKLPDEISPRPIKLADVLSIRASDGGGLLNAPRQQPVTTRRRLNTPNKVLIAVVATLGAILLVAYVSNPRD